MCGIAGFFSKEYSLDDLEMMLALLGHRGPDEFGTFIDNEVAIGSSRLAIIEPDGGHQPVMNSDENVILAFNGEVYNHPELRTELRNRGCVLRTSSDSEVLLHCYLEFGEDFVNKLNGQFAISVWDRRKRQLLLLRDRMGMKPLFYYHTDATFVFASEIKALFTHNTIPKKINLRALDQIFTFWTTISPHTIFQDIYEVPPGHMIVVRDHKISITRYWDWPFPSMQQSHVSSYKDESHEFVERLERSVDLRLRSDVEVGAYLSGGIDSSAIVSLANRTKQDNFKTFSISFSEKSYDERDAQQLVAKHLNTKHCMVECDNDDIEKVFKRVVWHTELPLFRTAPAPLFLLSQCVSEKGIKVVLTGEGADEILLGYDIFRELKIRRFWSRQPQSKWRSSLFKKLYAYLPHFQNQRYANIAIGSFKSTLLEDSQFYSHLIRWNSNALNKIYFSEQTKKELNNYSATDDLGAILPDEFSQVDDVDRAQYLEVITLLKGYLLSSQGDRMCMANSIEGRYPFLDHEFVAYANALPQKLKLNSLRDKYILRKSMRKYLPEEILSRPKIAYQAPETRPFIRMDQSISETVSKYLNRQSVEEAGIYNWAFVKQLVSKIKNSHLMRLGMRDNVAFVQILSTQILHALFLRQDIRRIAREALHDSQITYTVRINHLPNGDKKSFYDKAGNFS